MLAVDVMMGTEPNPKPRKDNAVTRELATLRHSSSDSHAALIAEIVELKAQVESLTNACLAARGVLMMDDKPIHAAIARTLGAALNKAGVLP